MAELRTFVFTDICRSVDLKDEMPGRSVTERDEAFVQQILVPHRARTEESLAEHGGRIVSTAGDGHFLVFENTILAAQWAIKVQKSHQQNPIATPNSRRVEVRMSMHVGAPQIDPSAPDNFIGKSVDYAARLNDYATGDQILVSRSVMAILDDVSLEGVRFHLHGLHHLKGVGRVEIHELLYDDRGPREMRQKPKSHSDRLWTVVPTQGFHDGNDRNRGRKTALGVVDQALKRIGNYELEERIGCGGMGDVYKARHTQFNRVRAIKVIKPELVAKGNTEVIRRFYHEIKAIGALEHRNIVVAIDSSTATDSVHYLVMEYIDGVALSELVDQLGSLRVADAAELVRQAARGLQFIHKNGMVHRDIKPSNLMLTLVNADDETASSASDVPDEQNVRGVVKILDLGLALLADSNQDRLTRFDNRALGTGMYMSPEQWRTTSVDIRADIYSLGCTLYHLLAGNPPFVDSDLKPEKAHEKAPVPPINGVPRPLAEILTKMMAKSADDRFATPAEVADALTPIAAGHDLVALARGYLLADSPAQAERRTRTDAPAQSDTWRSAASYLYPTRRRLLWLAPILLFSALIGSLWFVVREGRRERRATAEKTVRENLPVVAKVAAGKTLGREIDQRFEILSKAADDDELRQELEKINAAPDDRELWGPLREWLLHHSDLNQESAKADSWFVNDAIGTQVARTPAKDTIGKNFAYRDYFHGQGRDLTREEGQRAGPIQRPNVSAVFKSTSTGTFKVAFSVPVWSKSTSGQPSVLGVLSMSVDLGQFTVLERELRGGNQIVLIDLRQDFVDDGLPQRGLILHHPQLNSWWEASGHNRPPRVDPTVLKAMSSGEGGFVSEYKDPMPINANQKFWGAFEPVTSAFQEANSAGKLAGWMVLVQSQMPE